MPAYAWPADLGPSALSFRLRPNTATSRSPITRAAQTMTRQGDAWVARLEFARRDAPRAARLDAFLAQLDGPGAEIALWDHRRPVPRGAAGTPSGTTFFADGTAFTDGTGFAEYASNPVMAAAAGVGDDVLLTSGWQASATVLLAGDYVGINGGLHMVVEDVASTGAGAATLRIRPHLRRAAGTGLALVLVRPTARFRLADNDQSDNRTEPGLFGSYALDLAESLP